jgi:diguanylate cyclase (GGDEF)-like protein
VWLQLSVNLVRSGDDEPAYFMVQMQDITERKQMERELSHRAMHDDLTGLPNRALLNNRLEHAVGASRRTGKQIGLVFLDVDGFKDLNDALGHAAGDQLLVQVGERLAASVRPGDTVARFGGDEFVIVCADVTVDTMTALAGRIGDAMEPVFELEGRSVSLRASLGITISRPGSSAESLLSEADTAMYRAKELSRGGAAVFDESLRTRAAALLEGERSLRRALGQEEFHVYYQPVIDMRTEQAVGVEALVRWHTPDGRVVLPDEFIPMAERSGLIVGLGEIVLAQASAEVVRWNSRSPEAEPLWVSVNLSARQLGEAHLVELVDRVLTESGLPASLLHFEVAESVVMHDVDRSIEVLRDLRRLGVGLAIDDFGTGASSLAHLKQLPVDTLKVDRSLVANLGTDANGTSIVKAVIGLGRALGMRCLAEGVETGEQASALDELGCQLGQGYLWSRPLGPPDADLWAAARVRS